MLRQALQEKFLCITLAYCKGSQSMIQQCVIYKCALESRKKKAPRIGEHLLINGKAYKSHKRQSLGYEDIWEVMLVS